jgi:LCP family protein required for cell wall assembly
MGANTDSIILASVSADQSEVTLISLPRDTVEIPMPDGTTWPSKVNAIYDQLGVDALVDAAATLFDVAIDGYVQVDMDDLVDLVDAVDVVEVNPSDALDDPIVDLHLEPGRQTLDGPTALAYVRTRVDTDYGRAARQQEVLLDLVARLVSPETDVDVAALLDGLASFETDLPLDDLPTLLEIGRRAESATVTREVLQPTRFITFEGDAGDGRGYILLPDVEAIRAFAAETIGE